MNKKIKGEIIPLVNFVIFKARSNKNGL